MLGKFADERTRDLYELSLDQSHLDDEIGESDGAYGWYGRIGADILHEDAQGFVTLSTYANKHEAARAMQRIAHFIELASMEEDAVELIHHAYRHFPDGKPGPLAVNATTLGKLKDQYRKNHQGAGAYFDADTRAFFGAADADVPFSGFYRERQNNAPDGISPYILVAFTLDDENGALIPTTLGRFDTSDEADMMAEACAEVWPRIAR